MSAAPDRIAELKANLAATEERIANACAAAGRPREEVRLVVVTKNFPTADVLALAGLGVTDVGENRHQEAAPKHAECAEADLTWHFIGGLQRNKAVAVSRWADAVHSLDRPELVERLGRTRAEAEADPLDVLIQVSLDAAEHRWGVDPAELPALAEEVVGQAGLRLRGLMAVAPLGEEPAAAFGRLAAIRESFRADHPEADWLSAGMSGDLEAAINIGATHLRIGTAILGTRAVNK